MAEEQAEQTSFTIEQLLAAHPYNAELIPSLEAHVEEQISTGSYNLDANLALLRLYQFEPTRLNTKKISQILIKALMALPRVDCSLCLALVPEATQAEEPVATLALLHNLLESGEFNQFWTEAARTRDLFSGVPGFEDAVRAYALHALGLACRRIPRAVLAEAVNINGPSLDDFIQRGVDSKGWFVSTTKSGEVIELGPPGSEPFVHKGALQGIPLDHVSRLFPMLV